MAMFHKPGPYDIQYTNPPGTAIPSILVIDSRYRDRPGESTASDYVVSLIKGYPDAHSLELVACDIPTGNYNVNAGVNDTLHFSIGGGVLTAVLAPGLYTLDPVPDITPSTSIRDAIVTAMNTAAGAALFSVPEITTVANSTGVHVGVLRFSLAAPGTFRLLFDGGLVNSDDYQYRTFRSRSLGQTLGFRPADYDSADSAIYANYPPSLEMDRFLVMSIEGLERCDSNINGIQDCFCVLPMDAKNTNFDLLKDGNCIDNDEFKYYFTQPRKLNRLHIRFSDMRGNPYNFNGQDHTLVFRIETLTHKGRPS